MKKFIFSPRSMVAKIICFLLAMAFLFVAGKMLILDRNDWLNYVVCFFCIIFAAMWLYFVCYGFIIVDFKKNKITVNRVFCKNEVFDFQPEKLKIVMRERKHGEHVWSIIIYTGYDRIVFSNYDLSLLRTRDLRPAFNFGVKRHQKRGGKFITKVNAYKNVL